MADAFGSWLLEQFADATRRRLGKWLLGSEQERAVRAAGQAAIVRAARELRPEASDEDVENIGRILDQVFQVRVPTVPLDEHATMLQSLQAGMVAQLAVLGDSTLTGTRQSSAQVLGLPVERIIEVVTRCAIQEVLVRGTSGGALTPLADQLNHDLTHLQGQHATGLLERVVAELGQLTQRPGLLARPIPRELPNPPADFTGRADELAAILGPIRVRMLDATGAGTSGLGPGQSVAITVIDGMAGVGKSALAIQAAQLLVEVFPDGQLYVDLQGGTPGLIPLEPLDALGRMLRALGQDPAQIPTNLQEASARFRSLVASRRLLVVLDNANTAQQVRPLLPTSSTCAVLITSRHILATLERNCQDLWMEGAAPSGYVVVFPPSVTARSRLISATRRGMSWRAWAMKSRSAAGTRTELAPR
jgi:hypothetical protein